MKKNKTKIGGFNFFKLFANIVFILLCLCCVVPMLLVFAISLTPDKNIGLYGYQLFPKEITLNAYKYILTYYTAIYRSYGVTIFVTVVGTVLGLLITALLAYPLSRKDVKYRNAISMFLFFTMLFSGGLVASYILITRYLHLKNTIWVLILPMLVSPWNVMLMRNFFKTGVPFEIIEAAKIDGSTEFGAFFKIVVPISKPTFATIGLFLALGYWNDWWLALMYIDEQSLAPLQYTLQSILLNIQVMLTNIQLAKQMQAAMKEIPMENARMALCILSTIPILFAYPFFQKYIVSGLTVGAIKG